MTMRAFFIGARVYNTIGLYMGAVFERVCFATGSWKIGRLALVGTLGGGAGFTIGGSTLGSGRWCNGDVCTLGGVRCGIDGTGGLDTLGDWRRGNFSEEKLDRGGFLAFLDIPTNYMHPVRLG